MSDSPITESGWSAEWPTEEGFYFFFGWMWYRKDNNYQPQWTFVSVRKAAGVDKKPKFIYISSLNSFMYKSENHIGIWRKIDLPEVDNDLLMTQFAQRG